MGDGVYTAVAYSSRTTNAAVCTVAVQKKKETKVDTKKQESNGGKKRQPRDHETRHQKRSIKKKVGNKQKKGHPERAGRLLLRHVAVA